MTKNTKLDKDIVQLQQAIIDGLENVKAHDICVYDTAHMTPLFERVMVASGNSNRQTRAIAASIRDKVREAGYDKPRIGGEDNGEWITVDCGAAVAHIMQPEIRRYYNLEEIWGERPMYGLTTAEKKAAKAEKAADRKSKKAGGAVEDEEAVAQKPAVKKAAAKKAQPKAAADGDVAPAKKPAAKKAAAKTTAAKTTAAKAPATKTVRKLVVGEPVKKLVAKKAPAKTAAKRPAAKKAAPKSAE